MKITIFGTGYVGLVTGACLADVGHHVLCMDVDQGKIDKLRNGHIPIYEPGLESIVKHTVEAGRLAFTTDAKEAVAHGVLQFIAVGTPPDEDGSADLQYVTAVARSIGQYMDEYKVVVDKSTVPVGTGDRVKAAVRSELDKRGLELEFDVVSNPEFLKEGAAITDFMKPDRIIVGTDSERAKEVLHEVYYPFNRSHDRMIFMDIRSAELTKYAANSMLATKISFMNEIANLAERLGADIENVRRGIGSDPRIGYHFIYPGCGYGGSCFPKDVQALTRTARDCDYDSRLLNAVEAVNNAQKHVLFDKISHYFNGNLKGKVVGIWGLAFKPNTDDMREASSRALMQDLWNAGASVQAFDPEAMEETQRIFGDQPGLTLCGTKEQALKGADVLAICTEWKEFRSPDFAAIAATIKEPVVFDGRNLYEPEMLERHGMTYYAIGRGRNQFHGG
ncbi:UDP-glucose/GDP-mannose dehydrogenase family protein [Marinobacter sp.]|jgi:UDPglucose 6-dehydrogenase|uniref:UDP-glucose dehydrogenase family protein n=1 Tax=Marinobacter sp. TaxID=50741 RepID=UPI000C0EF085|nr:UDP-glucose/GDP-mannose dehydrogenase family protein [Marinobacter sp.]PHQ73911.1 MAG: UDP-glucose 6-dehydrogenase [Marinobacter sp.]|tara:strand:- start:758 stop:2101 length:1344 start_codon:yes stop_codon:yes gene_type:complete